MKWLTVGLVVSALGLGVTSGYLGYHRFADRSKIAALTRANSEMSAEISKLVASYTETISKGLADASAESTQARAQLDEIVNEFNATSSKLAGAEAQLSGRSSDQKLIERLVGELNAANSKIGELEATRMDPTSVQKLIDDLNAANRRISELEANRTQ